MKGLEGTQEKGPFISPMKIHNNKIQINSVQAQKEFIADKDLGRVGKGVLTPKLNVDSKDSVQTNVIIAEKKEVNRQYL